MTTVGVGAPDNPSAQRQFYALAGTCRRMFRRDVEDAVPYKEFEKSADFV